MAHGRELVIPSAAGVIYTDAPASSIQMLGSENNFFAFRNISYPSSLNRLHHASRHRTLTQTIITDGAAQKLVFEHINAGDFLPLLELFLRPRWELILVVGILPTVSCRISGLAVSIAL
jgi:hypothetical protein